MTYDLVLTRIEGDRCTIFRLRMHWYDSIHWRRYRKTWKYKVLDNALRGIETIVRKYGKPQTLNIMGYLAQYPGGPPGV